MVMAFYVKLGSLLVKQVSKPLASQLKTTAVQHPVLQGYLTRFGQRMHEWNNNVTQKLKSDGETAARKVFVTKLDDDAALKKAADFMGEVFIFSVAGIAILYEVKVSKVKDDAKAAATKAEKEQLRAVIVEVTDTLRETIRSVEALDGRLGEVEEALSAAGRPPTATASRWWPRALGGAGSV